LIDHYLKSAVRSLSRNKLTSAISIVGLAIALAGAFLVYAYIRWEVSYNTHFLGKQNVYRVVRSTKTTVGNNFSVRCSGPLAPTLLETYPEIEAAYRLIRRPVHIGTETTGDTAQFCLAEANVFEFLNLDESLKDLLAEPGRILLSESFARKLFGVANPVGQMVQMAHQFQGDYMVGGVFPDLPTNTTFQIEALAISPSVGGGHWVWNAWAERGWMQVEAYIRVRLDADVVQLESRIQSLLSQYVPKVADNNAYHLQPFDHVYLHSLGDFGVAGLPASPLIRYGDAERLKTSALVAFILILVASANYVNLTTARASLRYREVGVRKTVGASQSLLIRQFLVESSVVTATAVLLGLLIAWAALDTFRDLVGSPVPLDGLSIFDLIVLLAGAGLVGLAAGAYPSLGLSSLAPVRAIRQQVEVAGGSGRLRQALVTLQFASSIVLIAFTFVLSNQIAHLRAQNPGFTTEQVVRMPLYQRADQTRYSPRFATRLKRDYNSVHARFMSHPNVVDAASVRFGVTSFFPTTVRAIGRSSEEDLPISFLGVEENFLGFFDIRLVVGRDFNETTMQRRDDGVGEFILSESGIKTLGYEKVADAIGERMESMSPKVSGTIVGVIEDVMFGSFKATRQPLMLVPDYYNFKTLFVRVRPESLDETLQHLETTWKHYLPDRPFVFEFLDERIANLYKREQGQQRILSTFSWLSIFVGVMGVFGLAAFLVERRLKEISVRKVLGAGVPGLLGILYKDYIGLLVAATIVATPLALVLSNQWLQDYDTRITLGPMPFVLAALIGMTAVLAAVSFHSFRALRADPIQSLRQE
jgi:putative ABC transport system permease protein